MYEGCLIWSGADMTTDLDRTKELLDSFGVLYTAEENSIVFGKYWFSDCPFPKCEKVDGYSGFYTAFDFDDQGKFLSVGAWE